jgi:selenocysteine-specific elongation factor
VVTGTLWAGSVAAGDQVTILPRDLHARVRSVHVHDQPVERAAAGQRVALNLGGVGWRELGRGDVVVAPGSRLRPSYRLDARLDLRRPPERGVRVQVHHGTREAPGRIVPFREGELVQLRLEAPLVAAEGDRIVVRRIAPPDTLGGGVVVDASPRRHRGAVAVAVAGEAEAEAGEAEAEAGAPAPEPLDDLALRVAALLRSDGSAPRAHGDLAAALGVEPREVERRLARLERVDGAVRLGRTLHMHPEPLAALEAQVIAICERDGEATIASLRDEAGTSRRYAQAVLEHLDRTRVTRRIGDAHVLRSR